MTYSSIQEIIQEVTRKGSHFFDDNTMTFFRSEVIPEVYGEDGDFFITSEQFDETSPRRFTVREVWAGRSIKTVSDFQEFATLEEAQEFLKAYLKEEE